MSNQNDLSPLYREASPAPIEASSYFVVIEGLDGVGKTELSRRLAAALKQRLGAERVRLSHEPNDEFCAGRFLRDVLARRIRPVDDWTLALAFAANRADHTSRLISPFLDGGPAGRVMVCDRYYLSSLVYQSSEALPAAQVMALNRGARQPDLILFLDASNEVCYERMNRRDKDPEMFEDQLEQLREKYREGIEFLRARGEVVEIVDAGGDIPAVLAQMLACIEHHGPAWLRNGAMAAEEPAG